MSDVGRGGASRATEAARREIQEGVCRRAERAKTWEVGTRRTGRSCEVHAGIRGRTDEIR